MIFRNFGEFRKNAAWRLAIYRADAARAPYARLLESTKFRLYEGRRGARAQRAPFPLAPSALLTFPWEIKALSRIFVDFSEKGWGFSIAWRTFWGAVGPPLGAGKFPKKTRGLFATL